MDILKFEIGITPIKITRMILLLFFYISLVKKPSIYLILFIVISFTSSVIVCKNQVSIIALSLSFLARCVLLFYSYKIIKWAKIKNINLIYAFTAPIFIVALFFTMYLNNISFHNSKTLFIALALSCEIILLINVFRSFITFLKDPKKGNKEFLIGIGISLFADLFYSVQDFSASIDVNIVGFTSILYSIGFYMILTSHKKLIEEV